MELDRFECGREFVLSEVVGWKQKLKWVGMWSLHRSCCGNEDEKVARML